MRLQGTRRTGNYLAPTDGTTWITLDARTRETWSKRNERRSFTISSKGHVLSEVRPNILIIMPDEMRGDCLSLEHHPVLQTPTIDAIGEGGVHFTRAYTTCASCIAARRSLLTGQYPATNGMVGYREGVPITTPTLTELLEFAAVPAPPDLDGKSFAATLHGEAERVRDVLHGEHATCYDAEQGYHFLTDGRMKYIWRPSTGREQLFDLEVDPGDLHDLSRCPDVAGWRGRMIEVLNGRPEGFSDGIQLIAGCDYGPVLPHAEVGQETG
jgi:arylsulfatase A-like enzyme